MSNYNIIQVVDTLITGGSERMAVNITNVLTENNQKSYLCATRKTGSLYEKVSCLDNVFILEKKFFFDIKAFIKLNKIIKNKNINIVHAHSSSVFWAIFQKLFFKNLIVIWHDHRGKAKAGKMMTFSLIFISFFLDGVISVNDDLLNWSKKKLFLSKNKIVRINNFPEYDIPDKYFNKKNNKKINILCLANLRPQKNHLMLVEAIHILTNKYNIKNISINLAGVIYFDDYYHSIIDKISYYNLENYINILGPVSNTNKILNESHIGVLTSTSVGLPVSLLEYGMASLPTISTNVGQCAEVLDNGKAGVLANNPIELATAIKELISNNKLSELYSKNLFNHVKANFTGENFLKDYYEFLEKL